MCTFPVIIASKDELTLDFLKQKLALHWGIYLQEQYKSHFGKILAEKTLVRKAAKELYNNIQDNSVWFGMEDDGFNYELEYNLLKTSFGYNEIFPSVESKGFNYFYPSVAHSEWLLDIKIDDEELCLYIGEVRI